MVVSAFFDKLVEVKCAFNVYKLIPKTDLKRDVFEIKRLVDEEFIPKVINELRLDFSSEQDQDVYEQHMYEFLGIDEALLAELKGASTAG